MDTFVVRIWVPAGGGLSAGAGVLHGIVEHAASATSTTFAGADELLAILKGRLKDRTGAQMGTTDGQGPDVDPRER